MMAMRHRGRAPGGVGMPRCEPNLAHSENILTQAQCDVLRRVRERTQRSCPPSSPTVCNQSYGPAEKRS